MILSSTSAGIIYETQLSPPSFHCLYDRARSSSQGPEGILQSAQSRGAAWQDYNVTKRVEHQWKSLVHDSNTISAVSPSTYSRRFQTFLKKVFAQG